MKINQALNLEGQVAVITGGSGHLGSIFAETLLELGCEVCLLDNNKDMLDKRIEDLILKWPNKITGYLVNLEDESERLKAYDFVRLNFDRLDILVNNAAFVGDTNLSGWNVPFEEQSIETWRRCLEVNLTSVFHLSQILSSFLKKQSKGRIINISSIYGFLGPDLSLYENTNMGNSVAYATSKGGVIQLTRWLSTVLAPDIRVNCISPGGIFRSQPEIFVGKYVKKTPMARMAHEDDFKGSIAYLASDLSSYVTGQNLIVDGGWSAW